MRNALSYIGLALLALLFCGVIYAGFNDQRPHATDYQRTVTHAISPTEHTLLREAVAPKLGEHPGLNGMRLVTTGEDSLLLRIAMIQAAERTLDIQYYIIDNDTTGKLILEALIRAADRGVRVRVLMDDLNLRTNDPTWPLINAHPNIEIRVFNPFATRDEPIFTRISEVFTGIGHFARRMHNKVLVADGQVGITGGRNLGDPYFGASQDFNFHDIDVIAVGPVVSSMEKSFDHYWNDDESFPIAVLTKPTNDPSQVEKLRDELQRNWLDAEQNDTIVSQPPLAERIRHGDLRLIWAKAELKADPPSKVDQPTEVAPSRPEAQLTELIDDAQHEFLIVSPYFVPGKEGMARIDKLTRRGVKVRILTNSLSSIDAVAAYSGYRRYMRQLLDSGAELYEMKPIEGSPHPKSRFGSSSRASLHSKLYVMDDKDVLIGSFNYDPRSIRLNTEMVLAIHSPEMAQQVKALFERAVSPSASYHVVMRDHHLRWETREKGAEESYRGEPKAGFWRSIEAFLFAVLPVENQL